MKKSNGFKKFICLFMAIFGIYLLNNLPTNATTIDETVIQMENLVRVLESGEFRSNKDALTLKFFINKARELLMDIAQTPPNSVGFRTLGSKNFTWLYKMIKIYENLMKSLGMMPPSAPGVQILYRGTHFRSFEDAVQYQQELVENGIQTACDPRASGGRVYGRGVYFSKDIRYAAEFAAWGKISDLRQMTIAMAFDSVKDVYGKHGYEYCISSAEQANNMILCACSLTYSGDDDFDSSGRLVQSLISFAETLGGPVTMGHLFELTNRISSDANFIHTLHSDESFMSISSSSLGSSVGHMGHAIGSPSRLYSSRKSDVGVGYAYLFDKWKDKYK